MTRKQFLKLAGAGALGLAGAPALTACQSSPDASAADGSDAGAGPAPTAGNWAWVGGGQQSLEEWKALFGRIRAGGIEGVLLHQGALLASPKKLASDVVAAARSEGLSVHAWYVTMRSDRHLETHPDWYAVNRNGVSTAEDPPYVDYYNFMSPCVKPVRDWLAGRVDTIAGLDGVDGIHLDYIRFPDVILPVALQPKYDLDQDSEMAEFDYGYHPKCRAQFEAETGTDPAALDDPAADEAWVRFRHDQITRVVNRLAEVTHAHDKMISAAVFPTPDIARRLVRQDWPSWNLDAVMPMIYHNFYEKDVSWIETATREGTAALDAGVPLYSGLFVPELDADQLPAAVDRARRGEANGISLFNARAMTEAHWTRLAAVLDA
jgi:uncharacterized lipoprotein YddW (UPF0748 family)